MLKRIFIISAIYLFSIFNCFAEDFNEYSLLDTFVLPANSSALDVLPDGKIIVIVGNDLYREDAPGSKTFSSLGTIPGANFTFGAAFLRVSAAGDRVAIGNNDFGANAAVGIFDVNTLTGDWYTTSHFDAAWYDATWLLTVTGANEVIAIDTTSDPSSPNIQTVITNFGGFSGGIALDASNNLFVGNGFDTLPDGSDTGWIKAFNSADWLPTLSGGAAVDYENSGVLIVDLLSAGFLSFDNSGNLTVGGGDLFGGSGDNNYAAVIENSAVVSALGGGGSIDPTDTSKVRKFDPDFETAESSYSVNYSSALNTFYLRDAYAALPLTVFVYGNPFAETVHSFDVSPGQNVNNPVFNDSSQALGQPVGGGTAFPANTSVVTLGGYGGELVLGFKQTIQNDPRNPNGLDFILFGNAFWSGSNPNHRFAEAAHIEVSKDENGNGIPDDAWYLIPGSHIPDPATQFELQTWDDNVTDTTYPPDNETWIPLVYQGCACTWDTSAYRLPELFETSLLINPLGSGASEEGIYGYADLSPTLILGDTDGDNVVDDPTLHAGDFYVIPDDPFSVGISTNTCGGDAFDISWAIDPVTGQRADLTSVDFVRVKTAVNFVAGAVGEISAEIDAISDVSPDLDCNDNNTFDVNENDTDNDTVIDACDNCVDIANPFQEDCDHDGIADVCAIAQGISYDCDLNGVPDSCESPLNGTYTRGSSKTIIKVLENPFTYSQKIIIHRKSHRRFRYALYNSHLNSRMLRYLRSLLRKFRKSNRRLYRSVRKEVVYSFLRSLPESSLRIRALGKQITMGANGPDVPVRLSYQPAGQESMPVFPGDPDLIGDPLTEDITITVPDGVVDFIGRSAYPSFDNPSFSMTISNQDPNNALVLQDGDNFEQKLTDRGVQGAFGDQLDIACFVAPFLTLHSSGQYHEVILPDETSKLVLYELGTTNSQSSAYDFQDLVIAITPASS